MTDIDVLLEEHRKFEPPPQFTRNANVGSARIYDEAGRDPEAFWADEARKLDWIKPWTKVLEWKPPHAQWFLEGKINIAANCVDRHVAGPRADKKALIWEGEPGDSRTLTYRELHREVQKFGNVLRKLGVGKGDRVAIYLPLIPEAAVAMLACARIGAIHSVVFGGFSPDSLRDRINDARAKLLITSDAGYRRGNVIPLKKNSDAALEGTDSIENVIVVKRELSGTARVKVAGASSTSDKRGSEPPGATMKPGRDLWWHDLMKDASEKCEPETMDSEDVLYILYTSGTTGKPKGIVHTTGGYLTGVATTTRIVFDLKDDDVFWCTADIGWVTGHSYLVYGPLANGATCVMYEGAPDWPHRDRFWDICERHGVTILYTAPTAIRAFMKWGDEWPAKHDLSRLRLLGSVGEPINPEAWMWYREHIGGDRCPIVDTWWQTETGAIVISPLPGITATKPGSATKALPGFNADLLDSAGKRIEVGGGLLALTKPWPSMLRTIWGDDERYVQTYFSKWPGRPDLYFPGDGAKRDEDGYFWILGRVDDVLNVAGHRIGTMEVESALVEHPTVAEAAVVGKTHELKGQALACFVTLREGQKATPELREELREFVAKKIGALARPDDILFSADLPKTRSGKIMRRLLRDIAEGRALGDTTTLADPNVVASLKDQYEEKEG
jgi:acetyl-CoA synthetase